MSPDPRLLSIARAICEEIELEFGERVGEGSFKETFRVSSGEGENRALKVFKASMSGARTEREIDAMRRCSHPNIAELFSISSFDAAGDEIVFTIEEYLPGGTLAGRLENEGSLTRDALVELGLPLLAATAEIASHDLVHRDLKPQNILFRGDGETPVIVDFGIVRDLSRSPLTQSWLLHGPGTPYFAAPEQLVNDRELIDWRTDQFALGLTLFIARWGFHPFAEEGLRPDQIIARVADHQPITLAASELIEEEGLSPLSRMLEVWPVGRFRRPPELLEAWLRCRAE